MAPTDLLELLDNPQETEEVEYKRWLDLSYQESKAKLARHLLALANYGGGYIVFGFNDDLTPDTNVPPNIDDLYSRDTFTSIIERYASPPFRCDIDPQESSAQNLHIILRVPSHGIYPVVAKNGGPMGHEANRQVGVVAGVIYVRKPRPESSPISNPHEWEPILNRCWIARETQQEMQQAQAQERADLETATIREIEVGTVSVSLNDIHSSTSSGYIERLRNE